MKLQLFLLFCATFSCFGESKKAWTIMTYLAADNDLNKFAEPNIQQMMHVGSNEDRTILIYLAETKNGQKYGKLFRVDKDKLIELACDDNIDSGSRNACLSACRRAFEQYPAEHTALIFWDHGCGCLNIPEADFYKGIAYDQPLETYLTDRDLVAVLQELSQTVLGGKKIDILGFDACLMAGIELQTICAPYVDYYVSSEELECGEGWDYVQALGAITKDSTAQEVAKQLVDAYTALYKHAENYAFSAIDIEKIEDLAHNVDEVAKILIQLLAIQKNQEITTLLQQSTMPDTVTCFAKPYKPKYIDLDHLYTNIFKHIQQMPTQDNAMQPLLEELKHLLLIGHSLIQKHVTANAAGLQHTHAGGISVYWAQDKIHPSYDALAWVDIYPNWENLMLAYLSTIEK